MYKMSSQTDHFQTPLSSNSALICVILVYRRHNHELEHIKKLNKLILDGHSLPNYIHH